MVNLLNWWWPHSAACVRSALAVGYRVHVIVSDVQREGVDWLWREQAAHPDRIRWTRDEMPRNSVEAHSQTRFDYLAGVRSMPFYQGEPILVTDADVIHRRPIIFPDSADLGLWYAQVRPRHVIEDYAAHNGFPVWWSELANTIYGGFVVCADTEPGMAWAQTLARYLVSFREDGLGDRWGCEQMALLAAHRRHEGAVEIHRANEVRNDFLAEVESDPAIWYAHPFMRVDASDPWSVEAARIRGE